MNTNREHLEGQLHILQTVVLPSITKRIKDLRELQQDYLKQERSLRDQLLKADRKD